MWDRSMSMNNQVKFIARSCNYHLNRISHIRGYVPSNTCKTILNPPPPPPGDFLVGPCQRCSGWRAFSLAHLQRIQNIVAKSLLGKDQRICYARPEAFQNTSAFTHKFVGMNADVDPYKINNWTRAWQPLKIWDHCARWDDSHKNLVKRLAHATAIHLDMFLKALEGETGIHIWSPVCGCRMAPFPNYVLKRSLHTPWYTGYFVLPTI